MKDHPKKHETPDTESGHVTVSRQDYEKLAGQAKELESLRDKMLRTAADYENYKKRLSKERDEFFQFSQERLIKDLLPILDNFDRALSHIPASEKSLISGINLITKQLLETLSSHGLKRFSTEGTQFDPHLHEAVDQIEEEGPEGVIVEEVLPGYRLHDRLLRPAKVKIRVQRKEEELT